MSKRHTSSRRRTYGRRQHELHERVERRTERRNDRSWRATSELALEPLGYVDAQSTEHPYGFGD